ncbi:sulfatase-like hydrolase/transferase [Prosthecobacter algae]|uniref:Sulfatase-like hydrolase/transferase n=1 Tax=Prosthecobacter algae TaxID=1144682 RepID=A0ABP9P1B0_9BACT
MIRSILSFLFLLALTAQAAPPHVVFVLVDDFGWGDPASYGGKIATPNLDRLAREGMQFRQFYVASPICSASRCGIVTGQYPARWHLTSYLQTREGNRLCEQADYLDPAAPSLPRLFRKAGYATAHIGKWHLGGGRDVTDAPKFAAYGYDMGLGTYESPEPAAALGLKTMPWTMEREPQQVARHDRTRWMVDETLAFLKAKSGKPCLVNLWLDDTHTPFRPVDGTDERDQLEKFRAVLIETDRQIGRLLEGLRELGIEKDTLILLAGDNGPEPSFDHARTGGLRGMKWSLYEGGIRTPLIARWPGVIPSGQVDETTLVGAVDLFPTLASLTGIPLPADYASDGEDMTTAFKGVPRERSHPLFWEYGRKPALKGQGIRTFPYPKEADAKSPNVAVREGRWKLLVNADGSGTELYDLNSDPNETMNRTESEPEVAARLKQMALKWRADVE